MSVPIVRHGESSPFDAIRRVRPDGSEYWSARELSKALEYETWRNFAAAIDRAKMSCENSGSAAQDHFVDTSKMIELGKGGRRAVDDVELSRFGSYLTVMNGDPSKTPIAAAQSYFAIRTRQAETAPAELSREDRLAIGLQAAQELLAARDSRIVELEPKAAKFDNFLSADGDYSVSECAGVLNRAGIETGEKRLFETLRMMRWTFQDHKGRPRVYQPIKDQGLLAEKPTGEWVDDDGGVHIRCPQVRVTPKGMSRLLERLEASA
ncbi:phage antirepressor KilAC domain-containing protein [Rhodococcus sp. 06-418-5]|uniref:phage antirepressor KilAC domain-containing protein n=1 Tax=Rhodococcus sp. 06-418-5 TaxID=2022507 RepID=UPI0015C6369E|nr:phage antirepressor KilAC domain-containing protein [Rhodococcus sp. 06-418-5]